MRIFLAILMSLGLSTAALAGGGGGGGEGDERSSSGSGNRFLTLFNLSGDNAEDEEETYDDDDPRAFSMPAVVVPLSRDGRLTGFAYVQMRVRVADGQNIWNIQDNAHYALDRLIRAAYRTPLANEAGDQLDRARAVEVFGEELRGYYGANAIDTIDIRHADTRLLNG
ncbi:hypothetical protein [Maricaulis sp. CAU 1757]